MEIALSSDSGTDVGSDFTSGAENISSVIGRRNRGGTSFVVVEAVLVSPNADKK